MYKYIYIYNYVINIYIYICSLIFLFISSIPMYSLKISQIFPNLQPVYHSKTLPKSASLYFCDTKQNSPRPCGEIPIQATFRFLWLLRYGWFIYVASSTVKPVLICLATRLDFRQVPRILHGFHQLQVTSFLHLAGMRNLAVQHVNPSKSGWL